MKIVICDDVQRDIDDLTTAVSKWASTRKISCSCSSFTSPQELVSHLITHKDIDVLFLDISFGEKVVDGMAVAKIIRKTGNSIPIIFVTANLYRADDGYLVEAMGYLTKPLKVNRLMLFLDRIIEKQRGSRIIKIMHEGRITCFTQRDILYVEIRDHTVEYHTEKNVITQRATLSEILSTLGEEYFVQIHRSYIIALDKIHGIKTTYPYNVTLIEKNELPVSRKYIDNLLEVYSDNLLEKMI